MTVEAALERMAEAEQEARALLDENIAPGFKAWARDRLRLVEMHRDTLERHRPLTELTGFEGICACSVRWPCPDAQAVIDYWCGENA